MHAPPPPSPTPGSREWLVPPEELWPEDTRLAGHIAVESDFLNCEHDECNVENYGAKVPLQRIPLTVPAGGCGGGGGGRGGGWGTVLPNSSCVLVTFILTFIALAANKNDKKPTAALNIGKSNNKMIAETPQKHPLLRHDVFSCRSA